MNKKLLIFFLIAALGGGGYYYWHKNLSSSFLTQEKIKIGGKEWDVLSKEEYEDLGLDLRMIPNKDNAAILYVKASNKCDIPEGEMLEKVIYVVLNKWPKKKSFSNWYKKNKECLKILHEAVKKEDCQFPYLGDDIDNAGELLLPYLEPMRFFARLLAVEGKRYEFKKDYSKAIDCYLAIGKLNKHLLASDHILMSHLISCAVCNLMNGPVEMLIANKNLSKDNLERIIKEYERLQDHQPSTKACYEMEKLIAEDFIDEVIKNPQKLNIFFNLSDYTREIPPDAAETVRRFGPQLRMTYMVSSEVFEKWLELPAWEAFKPKNSMDRYIDSLGQLGLFSYLLIGNIDGFRMVYTKLEATNRGIIIFAAIKLYEKEEGHPPRYLKELETEGYVSELPKDPFSGRDYIYRVNRNGWIVYSVFDNLIDDGGAGSMPHNLSGDDKDKDLVFWSRRIPYKEWSW